MTSTQVEAEVYTEMIRFYDNLQIPTKTKETITTHIEALYNEYMTIRTAFNRARVMYPSEILKSENFLKTLDNLFDVSKPGGVIEKENVKHFLECQKQPGRPGKFFLMFGRWK